MRWFLAEEVPSELHPRRRGRQRTDLYHLPSLSPDSALKWRGAARLLEQKERVGRIELATWCGVSGFVERWSKQRVGRRRRPADGDWLAVTKEVWASDGIERARVSIGDDVVWTLCVDLDAAARAGAAWDAWRPLLEAAEANSYAGYLAARASTDAPVRGLTV